ncbi:MAG: hypothetical protein FRX49_01651 [Trebouxia sp. A1-2]|nr:MAG: hypothetical protein FRX49_01651 [Trebouxia sp. A1-2]
MALAPSIVGSGLGGRVSGGESGGCKPEPVTDNQLLVDGSDLLKIRSEFQQASNDRVVPHGPPLSFQKQHDLGIFEQRAPCPGDSAKPPHEQFIVVS